MQHRAARADRAADQQRRKEDADERTERGECQLRERNL